MSFDVVILDAHARSSLACIRAFGRHGLRVLAASHSKNAIGFASKYASETVVYPDPSTSKSLFQYWLISLIKEKKPKMLLPCSDLTLEISAENRDVIEKITTLPFPQNDTLAKILKKESLLSLASSIGIKTPQTFLIPKLKDRNSKILNSISTFNFPAVLKPASSFSVNDKGTFDKHSVYYPSDKEQALSIIEKIDAPFLLQQQIQGAGIGVFALCKAGYIKNIFCHQRLLEKPPSGGRSVLSQSISKKDAPTEQASKLLKELRWDGPAMVEFKRHTDGQHYLMEINPRFWGSLQLSIFCGVNFPVETFKTFTSFDSEDNSSKDQYPIGVRLRWCLGTLDHLFIGAKKDFLNTILKAVSHNSLLFFKGKTFHDVFQIDDIRPFTKELTNYFRKSE